MNIKDIAKLAGVSASTVSKVMNQRDKDISEETRERVLKVIKEQGYVPYSKYIDKEGINNCLIGLLLNKNNSERDSLIINMEQEAEKNGYGLLVDLVQEQSEVNERANELKGRKVSGLIVDSSLSFSDNNFNNSVVYFSNTEESDANQKTIFYYQLSKAGYLATQRLISTGHERIACISLKHDGKIQDGYKAAMRESDITIRPMWSYEGETIKDVEQFGIPQCLAEDVTAVVCGSWEIACCLCNALERIGIVVPGTMSVVAIGENRLLEQFENGITTVDLPIESMCKDAVDCLIKMLRDNEQVEVMREFSPEIIERDSVMAPPKKKTGEKIVVVGSMNKDITIEMEKISMTGETQLAERVFEFPGGKGGNQAVGAGKLGGQVYAIGRLGNDMDGRQLYSSLAENHVHMEGVQFDADVSTGKAYISIDQEGESIIVVYPGANRNLDIAQINHFRHIFENAKYCLLSMEIQNDVVLYTARLCKRNNIEVILKPITTGKVSDELLENISYFVPNENELNILVPGDETIEEKAKGIREKGVKNVIVTLAEKGCYLQNDEYSLYFQGNGFEAVDTTGGADSFISAMAVFLSEGKPLVQAIGFAIYASGITITRYGVQPALPDRDAVDIYEDEIHAKYGDMSERRE